jgi:hypothetical protein
MASSGTTTARPLNPFYGESESNVALITITGAATGGAELQVRIDGTYDAYTTVAAETATAAATAWAAALGTALGTSYTVTNPSAGLIRVEGPFSEIVVDWEASSDGTQSINVAAKYLSEKILDGATTAGTGAPTAFSSGFAVRVKTETDDRMANVAIRTDLWNISGGAKTARWRIHWYIPYVGWVVDQEVGTRTVTDSAGTGTPPVTSDAIIVAAPASVSRIAIELVDDGAGGNLANCSLHAYAALMN